MKDIRDCVRDWTAAKDENGKRAAIAEALQIAEEQSRDREPVQRTQAERDSFFINFLHTLTEEETMFFGAVLEYLAEPKRA